MFQINIPMQRFDLLQSLSCPPTHQHIHIRSGSRYKGAWRHLCEQAAAHQKRARSGAGGFDGNARNEPLVAVPTINAQTTRRAQNGVLERGIDREDPTLQSQHHHDRYRDSSFERSTLKAEAFCSRSTNHRSLYQR